MTIKTVHDRKRGCGWRKPGGLYLRSDGLSQPCGRLPFSLERCPVCDHGIKFTRGWTWVNGKALLADHPCTAPECRGCPLESPGVDHERVGLIWIGHQHYATVEAFIREADEQGVSRRIAAVPKDFVLGETWVYLAHIHALSTKCEPCHGTGWVKDDIGESACQRCNAGNIHTPGIFRVFRPSAIEYVTRGDESEEALRKLADRGITPVKMVRDHPQELAFEE